MKKLQMLIYAGMALTLVLAAAACGGGSGTSSTKTSGLSQSEIEVRLTEYSVTPVVASVPAGQVKFAARNIGGAEHELHVIRTSLAPDKLPTKADGSVDEEGAGVTMVDHVIGIAAGTQKSLTVNLSAGSYVLVCNVVQTVNGQTVSHYQKGMHAAFTVK